MAMNVLHIEGGETQGGAVQAARAVRGLFPDHPLYVARCQPTALQQAVREIGGYCDPWAVHELRGRIRLYRPDVVHLHRFGPWGTAAIVAAKREGLPVVYSAYDYWALGPCCTCWSPDRACDSKCTRCYRPKDTRIPRLLNLALLGRRRRILRHLNRVDHVIALSLDQASRLLAAGVTALIHVIPVPVTVPDLSYVERVPGRVVWCGSMSPNKSPQTFLDAVRLLREQGVSVDVRMIGPRTRGDYPRWTEDEEDRWLGALSREQTLREIAAAEVLVCTEVWPNPMPLILAEAMLLQTPVVAPKIGGIPELFPFGNADVCLYEPGDVASLARVLQGARIVAALSAKPTAQYTAHIRRHLDPTRLRSRLLEAYTSCLP